MLQLGYTMQQISPHQKWYMKLMLVYRVTWKLREFQNTCFINRRTDITQNPFILK